MSWRAGLLAGMVVVFTAVALVAAPRLRRDVPDDARPWRHPGVWLVGVVALILSNQVLFTAYVFAVHDGDPGFIARYLPAGWFELVEPDSPVGRLALAVPSPELLEWSVLRVQAFLELPFVLLAYLTVCRWFGREVLARAVRQAWLAAAAFTATFCLIELSLPNPYTADDVVVRVVSAVLVPAGVARLAAPDSTGPIGALRLLAAVVSSAALGGLVLIVYDVALLYNLGRLADRLPWAIGAAVVLLVGRLVARRAAEPTRARPGIEVLHAAFGWFLALFLVPALAIRYGLDFGARPVAAVTGLTIAALATARGFREVRARTPVRLADLLAMLAAAGAAAAAGFAVGRGYPEARLLAAVTGFLGAAIGAALLVGPRPAPDGGRPQA